MAPRSRRLRCARVRQKIDGVRIHADGGALALVLTDEPIAGYGPFVMNSEAEIRQAIDDFNSGRFANVAA